MRTVGIAELKTHLSRYLAEVRRGERFVVLDRSVPIAELIPSARPGDTDPFQRLIDSGLASAATRPIGEVVISDVATPFSLTEELDSVRQDSL